MLRQLPTSLTVLYLAPQVTYCLDWPTLTNLTGLQRLQLFSEPWKNTSINTQVTCLSCLREITARNPNIDLSRFTRLERITELFVKEMEQCLPFASSQGVLGILKSVSFSIGYEKDDQLPATFNDSLACMTSLTSLDFALCYIAPSTANRLFTLPNLKHVSIHCIYGHKAASVNTALAALCGGPRGSAVESLGLSKARSNLISLFSDTDAATNRTAPTARPLQRLKTLCMHKCALQALPPGLQMRSFPALQHLDTSDTDLAGGWGELLMGALEAGAPGMRSIIMPNCNLSSDALQALGRALKRMAELRVLDVQHSCKSAADAAGVLDGLAGAWRLQRLDLTGRVGATNRDRLVAVLQVAAASLQFLELRGCSMGAKTWRDPGLLGALARVHGLQCLSLCKTDAGDLAPLRRTLRDRLHILHVY